MNTSASTVILFLLASTGSAIRRVHNEEPKQYWQHYKIPEQTPKHPPESAWQFSGVRGMSNGSAGIAFERMMARTTTNEGSNDDMEDDLLTNDGSNDASTRGCCESESVPSNTEPHVKVKTRCDQTMHYSLTSCDDDDSKKGVKLISFEPVVPAGSGGGQKDIGPRNFIRIKKPVGYWKNGWLGTKVPWWKWEDTEKYVATATGEFSYTAHKVSGNECGIMLYTTANKWKGNPCGIGRYGTTRYNVLGRQMCGAFFEYRLSGNININVDLPVVGGDLNIQFSNWKIRAQPYFTGDGDNWKMKWYLGLHSGVSYVEKFQTTSSDVSGTYKSYFEPTFELKLENPGAAGGQKLKFTWKVTTTKSFTLSPISFLADEFSAAPDLGLKVTIPMDIAQGEKTIDVKVPADSSVPTKEFKDG
eukprot:gnl/MRDRNA2_/MRDRNA2_73258_c0_seq1.p1 gnl/MRDRNA2_/MRDRNA2_73258_c0~~gnl/MRDRNA2_/MRDRNA2_73258_c0_seq1.p1  ORF type:complete len:416 (-),score=45.25 gnl/MRDRNA2_/MRDRNA2_73258_c0_seq1:12-1259(-)